jgi:hypothetical protein
MKRRPLNLYRRRGTRKGNQFSPNGDGQNVRPRGGHCDQRGEVTTS